MTHLRQQSIHPGHRFVSPPLRLPQLGQCLLYRRHLQGFGRVNIATDVQVEVVALYLFYV